MTSTRFCSRKTDRPRAPHFSSLCVTDRSRGASYLKRRAIAPCVTLTLVIGFCTNFLRTNVGGLVTSKWVSYTNTIEWTRHESTRGGELSNLKASVLPQICLDCRPVYFLNLCKRALFSRNRSDCRTTVGITTTKTTTIIRRDCVLG